MASSNAMGNCVLLLVASFLFFFSLGYHTTKAQEPDTTGYNCTAGGDSGYPCRAYAFYRASAPNLLDLAAVGDLFSVSRLMISQPSNISTPSAALVAGQPLLIPLTCGCFSVPNISATTNHSYAPLNRTIISGDTFYLVSTNSYRNLTTYQSVEVVNPTLVPTNLNVGDNVIFPIFCKCPNRSRSLQGNASTSFLISYVFQPSDSLSSVATQLGSNAQSIADVNGLATTSTPVQPYTTIFIPVSRLPTLAQQTAPSPSASPQPSPPTAATERKVERTGLIVGLGVALGIIAAIAVIVLGFWIYREGLWRKRLGESERAEEEWQKEKLVMAAGGGGGRSESAGVVKAKGLEFGLDVSECLDKYRVFKIEELTEATEGFDQRCLVQGSVYKGTMDGTVYAIKKMKWNAYEELKILQKVNHGNLVKLEGFCIDPEDANCYLVYEYVENGSLHAWLRGDNNDNNHSSNVGQKLRWKSRLKIAIDVANGLQYIHEHTRPRVVHKDVKASNILLDANMRAKIANFGLAKSGCNAITMHIVGTQGYIAPEYLADGIVSTKMDVFSFGVVLLELISGREAIDEDGRLLSATAAGVLQGATEEKAGKLRGWMDGAIAKDDSCSIESVMSVMSVAVACLHRDPAKRPSMVEIVYALCKSDDDGVFDTSEEALSGGSVSAR